MKNLEINEMESIKGGSFCAAYGATVAVYGIGVAANWWNPVGWGGAAALASIAVGCAIYHWD